MGDRRWLAALKAAWRRLSRTGEHGGIEKYRLPDWLRNDLGLTEHETKSASDRINEFRYKHSGLC
jgi:hypothetical protein